MNETKVLLEWDDKAGKFRKYLLVEALHQNVKSEKHYCKGLFVGVM